MVNTGFIVLASAENENRAVHPFIYEISGCEAPGEYGTIASDL
jgi:hypothetical protein